MIPTSAASSPTTESLEQASPTPKDSPRESQKSFEASTSRSLISLFGQSQTYSKIQKTRSRKRLPEESCTRSNYIGQTSRALKTRVKEHAKPIATLDENSLLAKHHMRHNHQIDLRVKTAQTGFRKPSGVLVRTIYQRTLS